MANKRSCRALKKLFSDYEAGSGQSINLHKSAITFGHKVKDDMKRYVRHTLNIHNVGGGGTYLGLPEQIQSKKTETFRFIVDRVRHKTQSWNKRFLSNGGKEVLIKSVAMAMPTYTMNIFKLPKDLCNEIHSILADYWWRKSDQSKGIHWFNWKRLCLPKKEGGLGFKDLEKHNLAMLGKQTWRIMQHPNCLMARLLRGRYFHDGNIFTATEGSKASFVWKSILQGRDLLRQGLRYNIGTGTNVNAWIDPWLPTHPPRPPRRRHDDIPHIKVSDLIDSTTFSWNLSKLEAYVDPIDIPAITMIPLSSHVPVDHLGWHYTSNGIYTVRSGYWFATHIPTNPPIIAPPSNIDLRNGGWKLHTASKLQHFCWQISTASLPTGANLRARHITDYSLCRRCCMEEETTSHLFFECQYVQALWRASNIPITTLFDPAIPWEIKLQSLFELNLSNHAPSYQHLPIWILWRIWKSRNLLIFQQKHVPWKTLLSQARRDAKEWADSEAYLLQDHAPHNSGSSVRNEGWQKPEEGWVKCNYDSSFVNGTPSQAGWILRNHEGSHLASGQTLGRSTHNALESEFQALLIAMQNTWIRGYRSVVFEGDNLLICQILNDASLHFQSFNYQCEIKAWKERFNHVKFGWTNRRNNEAAHLLATTRITSRVPSLVFHNVPFILQSIVSNDILSL